MMPEDVRRAMEASRSPRVDALIERVMQEHPGFSTSAQARYYEAVHQELAPLARDLEARAERAEALLREVVAAHTGENIEGCDMSDADVARITAHLSENSRG